MVPLLAFALLAIPPAAAVSPLHPRIFVRHDAAVVGRGLRLYALRDRLGDPAYAAWRRGPSGKGATAILERAARYLEDGSAAQLEAVRTFLLSNTFSYARHDVGGFLAGAEMATAFDWIYTGLSDADRAAAMANIVTTADSSASFLRRGQPDINHNYTYMALNTVAVCGLVLKGEAQPYNQKAEEYLALAREFIEGPGRVLDTWNARQGAWAEGSHYTFHETVRNLVMMFQAYRTASDTDYFARIEKRHGDFLAKAGRFLVASTRPDLTFERIGDCSSNRSLANITVPLTVEALASGLNNAAEAARLRSFAQALREAYGPNALSPSFDWGMRIFLEPRAPRKPVYTTLPLSMRLGEGTYEHIMFRNGWTPDSTLITILAGDHFTDHQHFDKGQFLIYHRGGLAVDSGVYDQMYKPDGHWNEYASRTLAHNCLLVYDPDQTFPKGCTNDGGQNVLRGKQHHGDWPTYLAHYKKEGLDTAEVLAYDYDERNQYGYLRCNLAGAYSSKVSYYDRQFVYLSAPDFLVVFDRLSAARADFAKRWLLHFQDQPSTQRRDSGASLTTLKRHGQLNLGGRTATYDGALFVHTLLPAEHAVTVVGGPGHEFFNPFTGVNYPPSKPGLIAEVREPGTWRMEVAPARPSAADQFLHALQMADGSVAQPVDARLLADTGNRVVGVHFLARPENQIVLFARRQNGGPVELPVTYEISSPDPARHLLVELPPRARVVIEVNGRALARAAIGPQGVLNFRDRARGARKIIIRAAR
jgi:hypothetical protein